MIVVLSHQILNGVITNMITTENIGSLLSCNHTLAFSSQVVLEVVVSTYVRMWWIFGWEIIFVSRLLTADMT